MMKLALLLLLWLPSVAVAQVNIEEIRGKAKEGVSGKTDLGFEFQSGNTEAIFYSIFSRGDYGKGVHHYFLQFFCGEIRSSTSTCKRQCFCPPQMDCHVVGCTRYGLLVQSQYDHFKDLTLRQLEGGYLRVVLPIISGQVAFGLGGMSEFEKLNKGKGEGFAVSYDQLRFLIRGTCR